MRLGRWAIYGLVAATITPMLVSLIFPFSRLGIGLGSAIVYFVLAMLQGDMMPPHMRLFWGFSAANIFVFLWRGDVWWYPVNTLACAVAGVAVALVMAILPFPHLASDTLEARAHRILVHSSRLLYVLSNGFLSAADSTTLRTRDDATLSLPARHPDHDQHDAAPDHGDGGFRTGFPTGTGTGTGGVGGGLASPGVSSPTGSKAGATGHHVPTVTAPTGPGSPGLPDAPLDAFSQQLSPVASGRSSSSASANASAAAYAAMRAAIARAPPGMVPLMAVRPANGTPAHGSTPVAGAPLTGYASGLASAPLAGQVSFVTTNSSPGARARVLPATISDARLGVAAGAGAGARAAAQTTWLEPASSFNDACISSNSDSDYRDGQGRGRSEQDHIVRELGLSGSTSFAGLAVAPMAPPSEIPPTVSVPTMPAVSALSSPMAFVESSPVTALRLETGDNAKGPLPPPPGPILPSLPPSSSVSTVRPKTATVATGSASGFVPSGLTSPVPLSPVYAGVASCVAPLSLPVTVTGSDGHASGCDRNVRVDADGDRGVHFSSPGSQTYTNAQSGTQTHGHSHTQTQSNYDRTYHSRASDAPGPDVGDKIDRMHELKDLRGLHIATANTNTVSLPFTYLFIKEATFLIGKIDAEVAASIAELPDLQAESWLHRTLYKAFCCCFRPRHWRMKRNNGFGLRAPDPIYPPFCSPKHVAFVPYSSTSAQQFLAEVSGMMSNARGMVTALSTITRMDVTGAYMHSTFVKELQYDMRHVTKAVKEFVFKMVSKDDDLAPIDATYINAFFGIDRAVQQATAALNADLELREVAAAAKADAIADEFEVLPHSAEHLAATARSRSHSQSSLGGKSRGAPSRVQQSARSVVAEQASRDAAMVCDEEEDDDAFDVEKGGLVRARAASDAAGIAPHIETAGDGEHGLLQHANTLPQAQLHAQTQGPWGGALPGATEDTNHTVLGRSRTFAVGAGTVGPDGVPRRAESYSTSDIAAGVDTLSVPAERARRPSQTAARELASVQNRLRKLGVYVAGMDHAADPDNDADESSSDEDEVRGQRHARVRLVLGAPAAAANNAATTAEASSPAMNTAAPTGGAATAGNPGVVPFHAMPQSYAAGSMQHEHVPGAVATRVRRNSIPDSPRAAATGMSIALLALPPPREARGLEPDAALAAAAVLAGEMPTSPVQRAAADATSAAAESVYPDHIAIEMGSDAGAGAANTGAGLNAVVDPNAPTNAQEAVQFASAEHADVQEVDEVTAMLLRSPDAALTFSAPYAPGSYTTLMASLHHMWGTFSRTRKSVFFRNRVVVEPDNEPVPAAYPHQASVPLQQMPLSHTLSHRPITSIGLPPTTAAMALAEQPHAAVAGLRPAASATSLHHSVSGGNASVGAHPLASRTSSTGSLHPSGGNGAHGAGSGTGNARLRVATGSGSAGPVLSTGGAFVDVSSQASADYAAAVFSSRGLGGKYSNSAATLERITSMNALNRIESNASTCAGNGVRASPSPTSSPSPSSGPDQAQDPALGVGQWQGQQLGQKKGPLPPPAAPLAPVPGTGPGLESMPLHSAPTSSASVTSGFSGKSAEEIQRQHAEEQQFVKVQDMLVMNHFFFNFDRFTSRLVHRIAPHVFPHMYPLSTLVTTLPVALAHADDIMPPMVDIAAASASAEAVPEAIDLKKLGAAQAAEAASAAAHAAAAQASAHAAAVAAASAHKPAATPAPAQKQKQPAAGVIGAVGGSGTRKSSNRITTTAPLPPPPEPLEPQPLTSVPTVMPSQPDVPPSHAGALSQEAVRSQAQAVLRDVNTKTLFGLGLGSVTRYVPLPAPVPTYYKPARLFTADSLVDVLLPHVFTAMWEFWRRARDGPPKPPPQLMTAVPRPGAPAAETTPAAQLTAWGRFTSALKWLVVPDEKGITKIKTALRFVVAIEISALTLLVPWPFTIYVPQWAPITVGLIFTESVGNSLVAGFNRLAGNVLGAMYGYFVAILALEIDSSRGADWAFANAALLGFWSVIVGYLRTSPNNGPIGFAAGYAASIVALGYDPVIGAETFALARIKMTIIGVLVSMLVAAALWPERAETGAFKRIVSVLKASASTLELHFHLLRNHSSASTELSEIVFGPTLLPALSADEYALAPSAAEEAERVAAEALTAAGINPTTGAKLSIGAGTAVAAGGANQSAQQQLQQTANPFAANSAMRQAFKVIFPNSVMGRSSTSFMTAYEREVAAKLAGINAAIGAQRLLADEVASEPAFLGRSISCDILHEVITHQVTLVRVLGRMQECLFAHHWVVAHMPKVAKVDLSAAGGRLRHEAKPEMPTTMLMAELVAAACRVLMALIHDINHRIDESKAGMLHIICGSKTPEQAAKQRRKERRRARKRVGCGNGFCACCGECCCGKKSAQGARKRKSKGKPATAFGSEIELVVIPSRSRSRSSNLSGQVAARPAGLSLVISPSDSVVGSDTTATAAPATVTVTATVPDAAAGVLSSGGDSASSLQAQLQQQLATISAMLETSKAQENELLRKQAALVAPVSGADADAMPAPTTTTVPVPAPVLVPTPAPAPTNTHQHQFLHQSQLAPPTIVVARAHAPRGMAHSASAGDLSQRDRQAFAPVVTAPALPKSSAANAALSPASGAALGSRNASPARDTESDGDAPGTANTGDKAAPDTAVAPFGRQLSRNSSFSRTKPSLEVLEELQMLEDDDEFGTHFDAQAEIHRVKDKRAFVKARQRKAEKERARELARSRASPAQAGASPDPAASTHSTRVSPALAGVPGPAHVAVDPAGRPPLPGASQTVYHPSVAASRTAALHLSLQEMVAQWRQTASGNATPSASAALSSGPSPAPAAGTGPALSRPPSRTGSPSAHACRLSGHESSLLPGVSSAMHHSNSHAHMALSRHGLSAATVEEKERERDERHRRLEEFMARVDQDNGRAGANTIFVPAAKDHDEAKTEHHSHHHHHHHHGHHH